MNKLSIYADVRSIGWIITRGKEIIARGIKRINIDFDTYYEFIAGNVISKRVNRRVKRTMRRNLWRRKSRREALRHLLQKHGMLPGAQLMKSSNLFRYQSRVRALREKLEPEMLGLCFVSLQNKRGYKSMRGVMGEGSDYLAEIRRHEENLKKFPSIAAYLLTLESEKQIIFTRESYEAEFRAICRGQNLDHKTEAELFKAIYFQRPLRKGAIGNCPLEGNRKVTHKSHPVYQRFRCYRDANNVLIIDPQMQEVEIPIETRYRWALKLLSGKGLTKAQCCKDLGIMKSTAYTWLSGKKLEGNLCEETLGNYACSEYKLFDLWHCIYSATDDNKLAEMLLNRGYIESDVVRLIDIDFKSAGWGEYSVKAIGKLLPYLEKGMKLKQAILEVYGKVDFGKDVTLRNLLLEQVFQSTKSLVDALKKEYQIDEMQVELNQLLKMGNKNRKAMASGTRKTDRWQKEKSMEIESAGAKPTDYNLHKLKLWEEWKGVSPYEPDKQIALEELFTDAYNIDHIVPKSKIMERGFSNQVLAPRKLNEEKNRLTGIEYAEKNGIESEYRKCIESRQLSDTKRRFLFMHSDEIPTDYVSSAAGGDYNTRCFLTLHPNSVCIPNKIVNRYYREWGMNQFGDDDARSSLMKALVLANMGRETVEYFDRLKEDADKRVGTYDLKPEIPQVDVDNVAIYLPKLKLYRKIKGKYSPRFQLHKETVYGKRTRRYRNGKGEMIEETFYKVRKPILSLTKPMLEKVSGGLERHLLQQRLEHCGTYEKLMEDLKENPLKHNGKPIKNVSIRINANCLLPLHSTDKNGNTGPKTKYGNEVDFVYSSTNTMIGFTKTNGKIQASPIPLIQYIDNLNNGEKQKFDFVIQKYDVVDFEGKLYFVSGLSMPLELRPLYQLSADDGVSVGTGKISEVKRVNISQLGTKKYTN